ALKEDHGESTVWIVDAASMTAVRRPVRVGAAEGNDAVVIDGLVPGDRVVTAGVHVLSPGQKVRLYADPEAPLARASAVPPAAASGVASALGGSAGAATATSVR
ncbi:MAG: efflux RND transporter periplasmic adaptor subunit, partial [Caldimonas sp.]